MTTPTQAQIEAAKLFQEIYDGADAKAFVRATALKGLSLTAAFKVVPPAPTQAPDPEGTWGSVYYREMMNRMKPTTPTQAQVEAALDAAIVLINAYREANPVPASYIDKCETEFKGALAPLTAASRVGELDHAAEASAYLRDKAHKHEIAATIERCAQVAEEWGEKEWDSENTGPQIAAAIRKLRDEP